MDEGEGKKIPRRGTDPSSHHCVDTILTFVTRVWISLQRLGRREKGNFLKGIAAIAADQPRLPSSRQKRRWEREREGKGESSVKLIAADGARLPRRFSTLSLHTLSSSSQPVNQPPLIACGYYRGTTGGAIIRTLYPLHPIKPSFLIFTYFTGWPHQLPSFLPSPPSPSSSFEFRRFRVLK